MYSFEISNLSIKMNGKLRKPVIKLLDLLSFIWKVRSVTCRDFLYTSKTHYLAFLLKIPEKILSSGIFFSSFYSLIRNDSTSTI